MSAKKNRSEERKFVLRVAAQRDSFDVLSQGSADHHRFSLAAVVSKISVTRLLLLAHSCIHESRQQMFELATIFAHHLLPAFFHHYQRTQNLRLTRSATTATLSISASTSGAVVCSCSRITSSEINPPWKGNIVAALNRETHKTPMATPWPGRARYSTWSLFSVCPKRKTNLAVSQYTRLSSASTRTQT